MTSETIKKLEEIIWAWKNAEDLPHEDLVDVLEHHQKGYIAHWWHANDVIGQAEDMGIGIEEDEAKDIMQDIVDDTDANIGINWNVIREQIAMVYL